MENLIFNNGSLKIGYNEIPWSFSYDPSDRFMHTCEPLTRPVKTFREEAIIAAKEIQSTFQGQPLYAMYSGGIDSEAMMEAFRIAKVPVTAILIEFTDGSNKHDLSYAYEYLKRVSFTNAVTVIPFDIRAWLASNECIDFCLDIQSEPILTHLFKVANDHLRDGIVITAHEEPSLWKEPGIGWVWNRNEKHYGMHKYFIKEKLSGIPSFFQWSTELLASFIFNANYNVAYQGLLNPSFWSAEQLKYGFYYDQFGLKARTKYTGFERLIDEIHDANDRWIQRQPMSWLRELDTEVHEWAKQVNYQS